MPTNLPHPEHSNPSTQGGSRKPAEWMADDLVMDDLVVQTFEAERFEVVAMGQSNSRTQPLLRLAGSAGGVVSGSRTGTPAWVRVGSLAAAAALAIGVFVVFSKPGPGTAIKPAPGHGPSAVARNPEPAPRGDDIEPTIRTASTANPASAEDKLADFAHLDPELIDGLPTLSGDRSLVVAVYRGVEASTQDCDCLTWSVEDAQSASAKPDLLESALHTPCGGASRGVTLVSITGPRSMLPFHDDDARELVQCIAQVASEEGSDPCMVDDLCQTTLAALCLPAELSVRTLSVRLGE